MVVTGMEASRVSLSVDPSFVRIDAGTSQRETDRVHWVFVFSS